jgi:hypothetical protein
MSKTLLTSSELYATDEFKAVAKLLKIDKIENISSIKITLPSNNDVVVVDVGYFLVKDDNIDTNEITYNVDKELGD